MLSSSKLTNGEVHWSKKTPHNLLPTYLMGKLQMTNATTVTKVIITTAGLDPIIVYLDDLGSKQGSITIRCYDKVWSNYWGSMAAASVAEFFCSCDEHYLASKLSDISSSIHDIDQIRKDADKNGVECWRDDPWNDYEFMNEMYGSDMYDWTDALPTTINPEFHYLCRVILATQQGLRLHVS